MRNCIIANLKKAKKAHKGKESIKNDRKGYCKNTVAFSIIKNLFCISSSMTINKK